MNVLETIKNDKPTVAAIKDYYNKVSAGLNLNNYQYFYFQCSESSSMEDCWWDYGFSTSDVSIDENNMIAIKIDEFVYYKDKQIQEILDKLEIKEFDKATLINTLTNEIYLFLIISCRSSVCKILSPVNFYFIISSKFH